MSSRLSLLTISEFEDTVGSDALADTLARFSCPLNKEVESYLRDFSRAVQSSQMSSSVMFAVLDGK